MLTFFCIWDIPALIVFVVAVVMIIVHQVKHKKRMDDFEKQLAKEV